MDSLRLIAPAKVNLTLEVLGRREDGYHEVASVMQAVDLADQVRLTPASNVEVVVTGPEASGVPADTTLNLAFRAARMLQEQMGSSAGVRIELEKHIPAGAGLGGGSSDAAAVLRGLNQLWASRFDQAALTTLAACLGSDVAFFLSGGTAQATGRGEVVEAVPDLPATDLTLFLLNAGVPDKTRRMYGSLTSQDFTDGSHTKALVDALPRDPGLEPECLYNAFDRHVATVSPEAAEAMQHCRDAGLPVTLCGAGPSFFSPRAHKGVPSTLIEELRAGWGVRAVACRTLTAAVSLAVREE